MKQFPTYTQQEAERLMATGDYQCWWKNKDGTYFLVYVPYIPLQL